ncbi:DOCK family protein [Cavenderia fasciculata]|uniref:DOCK family protein n=1 Tax=Cavenderia fasciculata TaxID=261658 RepID=F4PSQ6_CACFS|nr:DOCK family protein [Cavenderia fasciculata]EGG21534.1 DOCK family protein [Cavenderia fasciculata]|eukprot:XP_004359384.1 DOCK family protein [Cavenderia fasciculata]
MNGQEYVYKEPKITRLVEIKDRLRTLFAKKFVLAETAIQIIEGSSVVDLSKLDENQCYLQITSVTPYFTAEESKSRRTPFEACVNLARFMFETPFTISGAGQGNSVADQYKRKTILTVAKHFPYTKKRIIVTAKQEINLSPIENAIEAVDARYETLNAEIKTQQPNFKTLQQVIQGSVRLQVNAGPQEICRTFFSETAAGRDSYSVEHIQRLKQSLSNFLGACAEALLFNKSNVDVNTPSSIEFQEEMEQGYAQLLVGMEQYQVTPPEGSYHPLLAQSTLSNSSSSSSISASLNDSKDDPSSDINNSSPASSYGFLSVPSRKSITQRLSNSFKKGSHLSDSLPNGAESI